MKINHQGTKTPREGIERIPESTDLVARQIVDAAKDGIVRLAL